ncbi:MAG TPA: anti-sigma factor [Anaerolineales bacterium]|nr:anti-sigma factor [Anaerolineales bacterium]
MDPHIEELLPFYVLDALTDDERELVESYLSEHPEARAQVLDLQRGASAIPYSVSAVEPPRRVKESLMARVASDAAARSGASIADQPTRRAIRFEDIFRVLSFGAATLAILWALVLNAQVAQLRNEISALNNQLAAQAQSLDQIITNLPQNNPSNVVTVSLRGTDVQPHAHGQLIADPSEQSAILVITGLSQLEPGSTYQVWLIDGGAPVSAGLLTVDERGQSVLILTSEEDIGSFNSLGISIEPEGGSPQPTGEIVVLSEL